MKSDAGIDLTPDVVLDPGIVPETPFDSLCPVSSVFLTGATGYLGGYLLAELVEQTEAQIYCLVRAANAEEAGGRIARKLKSLALPVGILGSRVIPVAGDLRKPCFGLDAPQYEDLARHIDAIYHAGADVNFVRTYQSVKLSTVTGTTEVLRLAARGRAKLLHHVSSLVVFGSAACLSAERVFEDDPLPDSRGLLVGYFQSKWVSEKILEIGRERGIPSCVYRPGPIAGHSDTGDCKLDDLVPLLIRGVIQMGAAPVMESLSIDFTPVDRVSRQIVQLAQMPESIGRAFNFVNPEPIGWNRMFDVIRAYGYKIRSLEYPQWLDELRRAPSENALVQVLSFFERLDEVLAQSARVDATNLRTALPDALLSPAELEALLKTYLDYFVRLGFIPPPPQRRL